MFGFLIVLRGCFFVWFGGDLLSRGLSRSTIGAAGLIDRVRDGIGSFPRAVTTKPKERFFVFLGKRSFGLAGAGSVDVSPRPGFLS